ncbi:hypothetical protein LCGC14_2815830 [marine sediment metagenome]|uniref:Uncharacterized protein n=1 Tax=marine sediment metagenome TaxID=412755 RepID=A0A0F8YIH0_9ZZZZ
MSQQIKESRIEFIKRLNRGVNLKEAQSIVDSLERLHEPEGEETCEVCKNVRKHSELQGVEVDGRLVVVVCKECIAIGWPEE